jgi:hypothetical protein
MRTWHARRGFAAKSRHPWVNSRWWRKLPLDDAVAVIEAGYLPL